MTFRLGQKVCCIRDGIDGLGLDMLVTKGAVYTVRSLFLDVGGNPSCTLYEIEPVDAPGWRVDVFRPAVERKTDISCFKALLAPVTAGVAS